MNRLDYSQLMEEVKHELHEKNGNFDALFHDNPDAEKLEELITAIALVAADRLYSRLTRDEFLLRQKDEHDS